MSEMDEAPSHGWCQVGRSDIQWMSKANRAASKCPSRVVAGSIFCAEHRAEALQRVVRNDTVRPWSNTQRGSALGVRRQMKGRVVS